VMLLFNLSLILKNVNEGNSKAPEELRKGNYINTSMKMHFERVTEESPSETPKELRAS